MGQGPSTPSLCPAPQGSGGQGTKAETAGHVTQEHGHWSREDQAGACTSPGTSLRGTSLPSLPWPHPPLVPNTDPIDDIGEDRGSEADREASGLGEPLVKRERSDPNPSLQGV